MSLPSLPAWTRTAARILLGAVFLYAALPKIADPPAFAKAVWNYHLLPAALVAPMALVLPWLELLCGLALVFGLWVRPAATWVGFLLATFALALGITLVQGRPVDCGCFGSANPNRTVAERLLDQKKDLARDLALLLWTALVWAAPSQGRKDD